jgi:hypothetical protein
MVVSVSAPTDPAELKLAIVAGHMIASLTLLNMSFTHRTQLYVFTSDPFFKLLVNLFFARTEISMKFSPAFEANFLSTLTGNSLCALSFTSYKLFTANLRAPSHHRILI